MSLSGGGGQTELRRYNGANTNDLEAGLENYANTRERDARGFLGSSDWG